MHSISIKHHRSNLFYTLAVASVLLFSLLGTSHHAAALSGSSFQAGNIIDDSIFFNSASMTAQQIQDFLNAKVPTCDTNGTQMYNGTQTRAQYSAANGYSAPFTCLKDYTQSTQSMPAISGECSAYTGGTYTSAQIIYNVAQACGISPKVLIVLLQKEQGLITDSWPWSIEYRSATGYGCPDTAPCDSQYYGFFNQVYNAASAYKYYALHPSSFNFVPGRNNNIQYSPSSSCGSSSVYIQNQATADLYIYTPYQPNQAALNNLSGTGDGCSSYGNRNFWVYYNNWFGQSWGSLVRTPTDGTLYYTDGTQRFSVGSMLMVYDYGWTGADVRVISQADMNAIPLAASPYSTYLSSVVKSNDDSDADGGNIYLITDGYRITIPSMQILADYGYSGSDITYLPLSDIMQIVPSANSLTNFAVGPDGAVYQVTGGKRERYFDMTTVNRDAGATPINPISELVLSRLPYGNAVVNGDAVFVQPDGSLQLYQHGNSYSINDMRVFNCYGLSAVPVIPINSFAILGSTQTSSLSCITTNSSGTAYLMAGTAKYIIPGSWGLSASRSVDDTTINRVPGTSAAPAVLSRQSDGNLSVVEGGLRRHIPSMVIFFGLGYQSSSVLPVDDLTFNSIPAGTDKFIPGSLLLTPDGKISVVISATQSQHVPTMETFNDYGFNKAPVYTVPTSDLTSYPNTGSDLPDKLSISSIPTLLDNGRQFAMSTSDLQTAYGMTGTLPTVPAALLTNTVSTTPSRFIKAPGGSAIYYMDSGQKRYVGSWQTIVNMGGQNSIVTMSQSFIDNTPNGSPL